MNWLSIADFQNYDSYKRDQQHREKIAAEYSKQNLMARVAGAEIEQADRHHYDTLNADRENTQITANALIRRAEMDNQTTLTVSREGHTHEARQAHQAHENALDIQYNDHRNNLEAKRHDRDNSIAVYRANAVTDVTKATQMVHVEKLQSAIRQSEDFNKQLTSTVTQMALAKLQGKIQRKNAAHQAALDIDAEDRRLDRELKKIQFEHCLKVGDDNAEHVREIIIAELHSRLKNAEVAYGEMARLFIRLMERAMMMNDAPNPDDVRKWAESVYP